MFEIVAGELRAKLGTVSAMRQVRSGCDTCAVAGPGRTTSRRAKPHTSTPGPTGVEGAGGPGRTTSRRTKPHTSTPGPTGVEGAGGTCRGAGGRRRGLAGTTQHHSRRRCGGRRRDLPRCRWAAAGPGRATSRRATHQRPGATGVEGAGGSGEPGRSAGGRRQGLAGLRGDAPSEARGVDGSRAGRRTPAHTAAGPDGARNTRGATSNANARQPERAAARSRSQWNTQRSRAATTSATWTAFRAAPLRRLSPETTRTRPRLPSTAWS